MRKKAIPSILILLVLIIAPCLQAQADPPYLIYRLKRINFGFSQQPNVILTWVITGQKSSHLVEPVWDESTEQYWLFQYDVNHKGKPDRLSDTVPFTGMRGFKADSVVFSRADQSGPAAGFGDTVMLFLARLPNTDWSTVEIEFMGFDLNGNSVIDRKVLRDVDAGQDQWLTLFNVKAGLGPNSIVAVFAVNYFSVGSVRNGYVKTEVYFAEFDFSGKQVGPLELMPLPSNGSLRAAEVGTPVHNGQGWMIPLGTSRMKLETHNGVQTSEVAGNDLFVETVIGTLNNRKMKCRKIVWNNDTTFLGYPDFAFLPKAVDPGVPTGRRTSAAGQSQTLFFREQKFIPVEQRTIDNFTMDYYAVNINGKGRKSGPTVILDIPEWVHNITYDPSQKTVRYHYDNCSPPILGGGGKYYFAQARTVRLQEGQISYKEEHQYSIYNFDPASGDVVVTARGSNNWSGQFVRPLLQWFRGRLAAINTFVASGSGEFRFYYSRLKPK